jgi:hypothetical protein
MESGDLVVGQIVPENEARLLHSPGQLRLAFAQRLVGFSMLLAGLAPVGVVISEVWQGQIQKPEEIDFKTALSVALGVGTVVGGSLTMAAGKRRYVRWRAAERIIGLESTKALFAGVVDHGDQ